MAQWLETNRNQCGVAKQDGGVGKEGWLYTEVSSEIVDVCKTPFWIYCAGVSDPLAVIGAFPSAMVETGACRKTG